MKIPKFKIPKIKIPKIKHKDKEDAPISESMKATEDSSEPIKSSKTKSLKNTDKPMKPLNLKLQILVGFTIPIFIVVFVGISAYNQSENSLIDTYETSTLSSIELASQLVDFGLQTIASCATEVYNDPNFNKAVAEPDSIVEATASRDLQSAIVTKQALNSFAGNIHIIPNSSAQCISSKAINAMQGTDIFNDVYAELETQCVAKSAPEKWGTNHPALDTAYEIDPSSYIGYICLQVMQKNTIILVDIDKTKILEILESVSLGEDSVIAYTTKEGGELALGIDNFSFLDKSYYEKARTSEDASGRFYVKVGDKQYLYMYSKCAVNNAMVSALVPYSTIAADAVHIRNTVIIYVIIACLIVCAIGLFILFGLQKSMALITGALSKASKGDLTVKLNMTGKSEFAFLSQNIMETISNTKHLISSVQDTTQQVTDSSENVGKVSDIINSSVDAISYALDEINSGMAQEAEDAEACLLKMDALSEKIILTSDKIAEVETLADNTKQMAREGLTSMEDLIEQSQETSSVTSIVDEKVDKLIEHTMQIEAFVQNINEIADQTTLLALNASIEAARAGEAGRGFTVVAEEIKKLSENSMQSAQSIETLVNEIRSMAGDTKEATLKSQNIVNSQQNMVEDTKKMFQNMTQTIEHLLQNMKDAIEEVQRMDADRSETLNAIQNISSVIEETLASSTLVSEQIKEQVSTMENLAAATKQLNENTIELTEAVDKFTV